MLPDRSSKDFPTALKNARIELNITRCALANKAVISRKLLKYYEEPNNKCFTVPSLRTWKLINIALGFDIACIDKNRTIVVQPILNIFNHKLASTVINKIERNRIINKEEHNCKTIWQPSSPYYKHE